MNKKELVDIFTKQKEMEVLKQSESQVLKKSLKEKLSLILRKGRSMLIFRNLKSYDSLDTLKILTFWKINQTGNVFLLDKDFFEGKLYTEKESLHVQETWLRLQDEYYKIQNDPKQRAKMRTAKESLILQFKVKTLVNLLKSYEMFFQYSSLLNTKEYVEKENEIFELFKELGYSKKVNPFLSPSEKLDLVTRYTKAVIGKYQRTKENTQKGAKDEINNLYVQVVSIERIIERPIPNIEKITVMQWIAYEKQANDIISAQQKINNGKR